MVKLVLLIVFISNLIIISGKNINSDIPVLYGNDLQNENSIYSNKDSIMKINNYSSNKKPVFGSTGTVQNILYSPLIQAILSNDTIKSVFTDPTVQGVLSSPTVQNVLRNPIIQSILAMPDLQGITIIQTLLANIPKIADNSQFPSQQTSKPILYHTTQASFITSTQTTPSFFNLILTGLDEVLKILHIQMEKRFKSKPINTYN